MTAEELIAKLDKQRSKVYCLRDRVDMKNSIVMHAHMLTGTDGGLRKDISDRITEIEAIEAELLDAYAKLQRLERKLLELAERLPEPEYKVICLRYCGSKRLSLEEIADRTFYSYRWVLRLHKTAKIHLTELLEAEQSAAET